MNFGQKKQWALMLQNDLTDQQKAVLFDLLCGKYLPRCDEYGNQFIHSVRQAMDMNDFKGL